MATALMVKPVSTNTALATMPRRWRRAKVWACCNERASKGVKVGTGCGLVGLAGLGPGEQIAVNLARLGRPEGRALESEVFHLVLDTTE
jgi:hypothetical protein